MQQFSVKCFALVNEQALVIPLACDLSDLFFTVGYIIIVSL